jgi:hypothetical protein
VTLNLTLQYDQMLLLLDPTPFARGLVRKKVAVVNYPDGRFTVQFEGTPLPFRVFDKIQTVQPGTIVDNKRRGAGLGERAAGQVCAASASLRSRSGAAAEQSGSAGFAVENAAAAQGDRRASRLTPCPGQRLPGGAALRSNAGLCVTP